MCMKGLGILLIVFGLLAAGSASATYSLGEVKGVPAGERFFTAVGGMLCCLTLVIPGIYLTTRGSNRHGTYRSRGRQPSPAGEPEPGSAVPVAPAAAARAVGADG